MASVQVTWGRSHKYCCHSQSDMVTSVHMPQGAMFSHVTAAWLLPWWPNMDVPAVLVWVDTAAGDMGAHAKVLTLLAMREQN